MVNLNKPVHRVTETLQRERGRLRNIVASLTREGLVMRLKGCRHALLLPYSVAFVKAATIEADRLRAERKALRKAKKGGAQS
jgi:hypothetical protein